MPRLSGTVSECASERASEFTQGHNSTGSEREGRRGIDGGERAGEDTLEGKERNQTEEIRKRC